MKKTLLLFFALISLNLFAQEQKENPVLFAEILLGGAGGKAGGFAAGATVNYQVKKNLFSLRYLGKTKWQGEVAMLTPFTPLPYFTVKNSSSEYAALYGWRFPKKGHSFSFSLGISHTVFSEQLRDENEDRFYNSTSFVGLPFEFNIKWFKKTKKRYRIYYIFPVGKPTAYGHSFGFKLFGNIAEFSYAGLGVTFGFGWHKKYRDDF